jgi:hypothetical protein
MRVGFRADNLGHAQPKPNLNKQQHNDSMPIFVFTPIQTFEVDAGAH